jgi:hypothetical protein
LDGGIHFRRSLGYALRHVCLNGFFDVFLGAQRTLCPTLALGALADGGQFDTVSS